MDNQLEKVPSGHFKAHPEVIMDDNSGKMVESSTLDDDDATHSTATGA